MSDYSAVLSLEDVKDFLNLTETEDKLDAWLGREVKSQLQVIEEYLDRPVIVQQFREEIDSTGGTILKIENTPVQSVIDLFIDNDRRFRESSRIDNDQFIVDEDSIELQYDRFPYGHRNVRVNYIAGYAEIEIPFSRQRFDIRETSGGDLLTCYLPTGRWQPTELAEALESVLNSVGDYERSVTFDWTHRRMTIHQPEHDYLQIVTNQSNAFTTNESATGLLGFKNSATLADSVIVGASVGLGIPEAIRSVALELVAIQYASSSFNGNRYGLKTYQLGDYRVDYDNDSESGSEDGAGIPNKLKNRLKPYKRWDLF